MPAKVEGMAAVTLNDELRERMRGNLTAFTRRSHELDGRRAAAVTLTLVDDDAGEACFVLTRRASRLKDHAGQWALPGGRVDDGETVVAAALRELREEVGLRLPENRVLGVLDDYPTRSGFVITPVVLWGGSGVGMEANPDEVAEIHRVPLEHLERPGVPGLREIPESDRPVISIPIVGTNVHAPTAAVIYQLREVAVHGRDTRVDGYEQPVWAWR